MKEPLGLVSVLAAIAALAVGWALGAWTTCGSSCHFDVDLFGALAGWVGGVGTAAAAWFAAYQFRQSLRDDDDAILATARLCVLRISPAALDNGRYMGANVTFINRTDSPVTDVVVRYKGKLARAPLPEKDNAGRSSIARLVNSSAKPWGFKWMFADHHLPPVPAGDSPNAVRVDSKVQKELNSLREQLEFEFNIGRRRFRRVGEQVTRIKNHA